MFTDVAFTTDVAVKRNLKIGWYLTKLWMYKSQGLALFLFIPRRQQNTTSLRYSHSHRCERTTQP